jgi:hypothetical protein
MKDVAIILPSIRPQNLVKFYRSAEEACKKHSFEIVIPSPYLIPEELMTKGNVKFIHTYANPTISFQMAVEVASAKFIYNTTDDGLIQSGSIDLAVEMFNYLGLTKKDAINMMYKEGVLDPETLEPLENQNSNHPKEYWTAHYHADLRLPGIQSDWKLCMHFFMQTEYFKEIGGFDCNYEYSNHALHDLIFRLQADGGSVNDLPQTAYLCSHLPGHAGDHGPVNDAQLGPDLQRFNKIYSGPGAAFKRICLDYGDWKNKEEIWTRRFDPNNLRLRP